MRPNCINVLLVEDDPLDRRLLQANIGQSARVDVQCAASGEEALERLSRERWDAVMTDLMMPGMNGIELVRRIRQGDSILPIFVVTANSAVDRAVEGMRAGATDYLVKPIDVDRVASLLESATRGQRRGMDAADQRIVGAHPRLDEVRQFARRIAAVPFARVFISGRSGTGKTVLAHVIHELSGAAGDFVVVNCAALPGTLLESELFGHEKGAFTDARMLKRGLIELAHEGTLFLDEIGAMPLDLQAKLLLFLESHEVRRVGGTRSQPVRTRVIAATNEDLRQRMRERTFRSDLLYRLDVASIELPPLAEMASLIPELAERFVSELCAQFGRPVPELTDETFAGLLRYTWPGNMRELRNAAERALVFHQRGPLIVNPPTTASESTGFTMPYAITLEDVERRYIAAMIDANPQGDFMHLAAVLGISRKTLWQKRRKYGL